MLGYRDYLAHQEHTEALHALYSKWGNLRSLLKAQKVSVHHNPILLQLEKKIASLEMQLRESMGITLRLSLIPTKWGYFQRERERIAIDYGPTSRDIALVLRGKSQTETESIEASKRLEKAGVKSACIFSGPSGVFIVSGDSATNVHEDIYQAVWGNRDDLNLRPPFVSGVLVPVNEKHFFILDGEHTFLWPSEYYTEENGRYSPLGVPIISMSHPNVSKVVGVYRHTGKPVIENVSQYAIILSNGENNFSPILIEGNEMQYIRSRRGRGVYK